MFKAIGITAAALLAAGCTTSSIIPAKLNPAGNEAVTMIVPAKGVQIYECRASKSQPGAYEWAFVAPDAELFDTTGKLIGKHYAGPHWEAADGSKVVAKLVERADAPKAGDIPWLLLGAKSVGRDGAFSQVTSIQRVNTVGGVAPKAGCSEGNAGTPARVPYTADYYFFTPR
jgi:hypothetical protein